MSAKEFIDARVVLEAKRRLVHELTPVTLIARDLGFDDPSNFSKYFSQRVGQPERLPRSSPEAIAKANQKGHERLTAAASATHGSSSLTEIFEPISEDASLLGIPTTR